MSINGSLSVRVVYNNFPKIAGNIKANAGRIVAGAALDLVGQTKHNIVAADLVDTGHMLNAVEAHQIGPMRWLVVCGAEYHLYHEMGTRFMPARPTLGPAADLVRPKFLAAMRAVVG